MAVPQMVFQQLAGAKRRLVLRGRARPLRPLPWGGVRQRGDVRWYPGSPVGSVHLMGPEWLPSEMLFRWKSRSLANGIDATLDGKAVTDADDLVETMAQIVADTVLVSVEYNGRVPVGFVREYEPTAGRAGEWSVRLEFQPAKWDETVTRPKLPSAFDAKAKIREIDRQWSRALQVAQRPAAIARDHLSTAELAVNATRSAIDRGHAATGSYGEVGATAVDVQGGAAEAMADIATEAGGLRTAIEQQPTTLAGSDDPLAIITGRRFVAEIAEASARARQRAELERRRQDLAADPDLVGIHTGIEGELLQLVCWNTYRRVDVAQDVAIWNGLRSLELSAGQRVLLPALEVL